MERANKRVVISLLVDGFGLKPKAVAQQLSIAPGTVHAALWQARHLEETRTYDQIRKGSIKK